MPPGFLCVKEQRVGGLHVGVTVHRKTVVLDPYFFLMLIVGLYGGLKSCMPINAIDVNVQVKGFCVPEFPLSTSRGAKSRFMRMCGAS